MPIHADGENNEHRSGAAKVALSPESFSFFEESIVYR